MSIEDAVSILVSTIADYEIFYVFITRRTQERFMIMSVQTTPMLNLSRLELESTARATFNFAHDLLLHPFGLLVKCFINSVL
jgi:hypothetical protein